MKRPLKLNLILGMLIFAFIPTAVEACNFSGNGDKFLSAEIKKQLTAKEISLFYPKSVLKFYRQNDFQPAWIKPQGGMGPTWQAMIMIDCVLQFGLSHDDYHPKELTYGKLHDILDTPGKVKTREEARYEILLTDAVVTLMNNLHYGKLNPNYSAIKIDNGLPGKFNAGEYLTAAIKQKDVMAAIAAVQPQNKLYEAMQGRMHLLKGIYADDCYEIPEAEVRKIAINMERLRWQMMDEGTYVHVNIPSYTLQFHQPDTTYSFKIIVGRSANPTPTLQSTISYFTTAPEWKVPSKIFIKELLPKAVADKDYLENNNYSIYDKNGSYLIPSIATLSFIRKRPYGYYARRSSGCENALGSVVYRLSDYDDIFLHDTPKQWLFKKQKRDMSHGCIRIEKAEEFGVLLLMNDGALSKIPAFRKAVTNYQKQTFKLKKPVAVHITYLTCEIKEGEMITYEDIYNLDKSLEMALYNEHRSFVENNSNP